MEKDAFKPWVDDDFGRGFVHIIITGIPTVQILLCLFLALVRESVRGKPSSSLIDTNVEPLLGGEDLAHVENDNDDFNTPKPRGSSLSTYAVLEEAKDDSSIPPGLQFIRRVAKTPFSVYRLVSSVAVAASCAGLFSSLMLAAQTNINSGNPQYEAVGFGIATVGGLGSLALARKEAFIPYAETLKYADRGREPFLFRLYSNRLYWLLYSAATILRLEQLTRHWPPHMYMENRWHILTLLAQASQVLIACFGLVLIFHSTKPRENPYMQIKNAFGVDDLSEVAAELPGKPEAPEMRANLLSIITFYWVEKLIKQGRKTVLESQDMFQLKPDMRSAVTFSRLDYYWKLAEQSGITKWSYAKVLLRVGNPNLVFSGLYKIVYDSLCLLDVLFLNSLIKYMGDDEATKGDGLILAFLMGCNAIMETVLLHQYFQLSMSVGNEYMTSIATAIYNKSLKIDHVKLTGDLSEKFSSGKMLNLMSVDASKISELTNYGHGLWSAPYQIIVISVLLYLQVGYAAFAGIGIMVLAIPLSSWVTQQMKGLIAPLQIQRDKRIKATSELISGIRAVKVYAWEEAKRAEIEAIRADELVLLRKVQVFGLVLRSQMYAAPIVVALVTFGVFVGAMGETLTASVAFTSLALFNNLRFPLLMLPVVLVNFAEAAIATTRLQEYMLLPELDPRRYIPEIRGEPLIKAENVSLEFEDANAPVFRNVSMIVRRGEMIGLVGSTGCGKSTLLSALLKDLSDTKGLVELRGDVAYCSQTAWIQTGTIRENIMFGRPWDERRYKKVVAACALKPDFELLRDGDSTIIGERGVNLSGGQKQRVALARAVYRNADTYLFDDVLSAVDMHVAEHIYQHVFLGLLKDKAILVATHRFECLRTCKSIIMLVEGGEPKVFDGMAEARRDPDFLKLADEEKVLLGADENVNLVEEAEPVDLIIQTQLSALSRESGSVVVMSPDARSSVRYSRSCSKIIDERGGSVCSKISSQASKLSKTDMTPDKLNAGIVVDDAMKHGSVSASVYVAYFKAAGGWGLVSLIVLLNVVAQGLTAYSGFWLSDWSADPDMSLALGFGVYAGVQLGSILILIGGYYTLVVMVQRGAQAMHSALLDRVLHATIGFFESNPIGRLTNRFSKEINSVDSLVPSSLNQFLAMFLSVLSTIVTIGVVVPIMIAIIVPMCGVYLYIERLYVSVARQFKRIESVTRAPVFSNFSETLDGVKTVRAHLEQNQFKRINLRLLDENLAANYVYISSNRWLAVRLETIGTVIAFGVALTSVLSKGSLSASMTGLAIMHAIGVTGALNWLVRMSGEREASIVSVERITEYGQDAICPQEQYVSNLLPEHKELSIPGKITFCDVGLRYREGLPFAIRNVTFDIHPGEKVGVVGRTGAGKSSLLVCLLRLVEITEGRITVHGNPTSLMAVDELRRGVSIIPQDAVLFTGTVRSNLDPFNKCTDDQIWESLERSCLSKHIKNLPDQLNSPITEGGGNFSVGQRQLLCLARVLLAPTSILLLDEATSAVDPQTDSLIQHAIRTEFKACTVLTIAHRLKTVVDYDRLIVMKDGGIAEIGKPQLLLQDPESLFHGMYHAGDAE